MYRLRTLRDAARYPVPGGARLWPVNVPALTCGELCRTSLSRVPAASHRHNEPLMSGSSHTFSTFGRKMIANLGRLPYGPHQSIDNSVPCDFPYCVGRKPEG